MKLEVTRGIECGERGYGDESGECGPRGEWHVGVECGKRHGGAECGSNRVKLLAIPNQSKPIVPLPSVSFIITFTRPL